jgi:hypothetical protein
MCEAIRQRDQKVFEKITEFGVRSIRSIAETIGISKDRVIRSLRSIGKRNTHPESLFFETEEGAQWLRRLVFAVLFEFGVKSNQGADNLSDFFKRLNLDKHIGVSPTALRTILAKMELHLARYQEIHGEHSGKTPLDIIASGDEKFFNEMMILVLMDLGSGYIIVEEEASDRGYETWNAKA